MTIEFHKERGTLLHIIYPMLEHYGQCLESLSQKHFQIRILEGLKRFVRKEGTNGQNSDKKDEIQKKTGYRAHINSKELINYNSCESIETIKDCQELFSNCELINNSNLLFDPNKNLRSLYNWTGFGLYFFLNNIDITYFYAQEALRRESGFYPWTPLAIIKGDICPDICLDLSQSNPHFFTILLKTLLYFDNNNQAKELRRYKMDKLLESKGIEDDEKENWEAFSRGGINEFINHRIDQGDNPTSMKKEEKQHLVDCFLIRLMEYLYFKKISDEKYYIKIVESALHEPLFQRYYKKYNSHTNDYINREAMGIENMGKKEIEKSIENKVNIDNFENKITSFYGSKFHYKEIKITPEVFINDEIESILENPQILDIIHWNEIIDLKKLQYNYVKPNIEIITDNNNMKPIFERILQQAFTIQDIKQIQDQKYNFTEDHQFTRILIKKDDKDGVYKVKIFRNRKYLNKWRESQGENDNTQNPQNNPIYSFQIKLNNLS